MQNVTTIPCEKQTSFIWSKSHDVHYHVKRIEYYDLYYMQQTFSLYSKFRSVKM